MYRFFKKVSLSNLTWKLPWANPLFTRLVEAANNLTTLLEVEKHFTEFVKFANNCTKFVEFANKFKKFVEFANIATKFVGLANNFYEVRRSCEQLYKVPGTHQ